MNDPPSLLSQTITPDDGEERNNPKKSRLLPISKCDCMRGFCQSGEVLKLLEQAGCHNLLEIQSVLPHADPATTYNQRKHVAFRRTLEHHLKIPKDVIRKNKRYSVYKFHWPIPLLRMSMRSTTLLNPKVTETIMSQQLSFGITSNSLLENCNTYSFAVRDLINASGTMLTDMEKVELRYYVQAPIASKDDIEAYVLSLPTESDRAVRRNNRVGKQSAEVTTSEIVPVTSFDRSTMAMMSASDEAQGDHIGMEAS